MSTVLTSINSSATVFLTGLSKVHSSDSFIRV
jgi:hypothetical protein